MHTNIAVRSIWALFLVIAPLGCVLNPTKTFEEVYGDQFIGTSIDSVIKDRGEPLEMTKSDRGTQIYSYAFPRYHPEQCTIFWEVKNGKITGMTHQGPNCRVYN